MKIRVLLLDKESSKLYYLIGRPDYSNFYFILHKNTDVLDENETPIGFSYEPKTLLYLDSLMCTTPFDYIIASSESHIQFAGLLRMRYGLTSGINASISAYVSNKLAMRRRLKGNVPSPEFWNSGEFLETALSGNRDLLPDEVVIKPIYGSSSTGVVKKTLEEAVIYLKNNKGIYIVEEFLSVDVELHCDGYFVDESLEFFLVSRYARPWLKSGTLSNANIHLPMVDYRYNKAKKIVISILKELGLKQGVFHIELFEKQGDLYFGEIAMRPGGGGITESINYFFNVDMWDIYIKLALSLDVNIKKPEIMDSSYCGLIGLSKKDSLKRHSLKLNPFFSKIITLRNNKENRCTGSLVYHEWMFFSCENENEVLNEFSRLT
ncbi:Phosphoribosylglycinamide formyltransferase 2 [Marinomonas spartinae]|uniref:ATP-grasp domain-containing protein n=1 Tax=Marinomonas spartinae TaxID=1792290 RepID=UPI000808FB8B|nr:ATP-grasp domain-containing protein [Marinomonas spartinae]SBS39139.1 Phosphoribosylglycinamide formyltransferase 2 [Marinomonas spartinae]